MTHKYRLTVDEVYISDPGVTYVDIEKEIGPDNWYVIMYETAIPSTQEEVKKAIQRIIPRYQLYVLGLEK